MEKKARHSIFINFIPFLLLCSILILSCQKAEEPPEEAQAPLDQQAQTAPAEPAQAVESDFLTLYPGVLTEKEKAPVTEWLEDARAINERGTIDIKAMINGTLPEYTPGYVRSFKISETMMRYFNQLRNPENPLLNDSAYAKKAGYKDIIGYPTLAAHDDSFMVAYPNSARDKLLVADLIHSVTNLKPVYPGDTLYWVIDSRHVKDLTPDTGSEYRSNAIINNGSVYNQRGEKVLDLQYTVEENIKVYKEGKGIENPSFNDVWEEMSRGTEGGAGGRGGEGGMPGGEGGMPEGAQQGEGGGRSGMPGGSGTSYYYTDDDWNILKGIWSDEKHQGAAPLYWEDVEIGDQPTCTLEGPVESNPSVAVPWGMGLGGNQTLKKYIMDSDIFKTLVRSETDGIYRPANEEDYVLPVPDEARTGFQFGEMGEMDAVLSGAPGASGDAPAGGGMPGGMPGGEGGMPGGAPGGEGGAPGGMPGGEGGGRVGEGGAAVSGGGGMGGGGMMNFSRRDYAIRHFIDWMGDSGWLYNIRWGGLYSRDMAAQAQGGAAPVVNPEANHWLEQANVPSEIMEPLYPLGQGNGDSKFIIIRSYVYNKYVLNGEFFVDLGWWIETVGGSNFGEGAATIKLPSKKAN